MFWRDIPAQLLIRQGRRTVRRQLPPRFQEAIDRAAMRAGVTGTDAYLAAWRRSDPEPCGEDLEAEAERGLASLEAAYPPERLRRLVATGGFEPAA